MRSGRTYKQAEDMSSGDEQADRMAEMLQLLMERHDEEVAEERRGRGTTP